MSEPTKLTTAREIFDYLAGKYPGMDVQCQETFKNNDIEPHSFMVVVGGNYAFALFEPLDVPAMLQTLHERIPTPEQKRAALEKAREEAAKALAEIDRKLSEGKI